MEYLRGISGFVGTTFIIYTSYRLTNFLWIYVRPSSLPRYLDKPSDNDTWALVTGSSDGIGYGFAQELAHQGFNVILHGRNETKLSRCRDLLQKDFPKRSFRVCEIDTTDPDAGAKMDLVVRLLRQKYTNLRVLVNNVGGVGSMKPWKALVDRTPEEVDTFISTNATFPTQITRALLPLLYKATPSLIINIGSFAGEHLSPYLTVYSGAKAFNLAWSGSLKAEMATDGKDVEVLGVVVGPVGDTPGQGGAVNGLQFFTPTNRMMAKATLSRVGCGEAVVTAYFRHALLKAVFDWIPSWMTVKIASSIARQEREKEAKTD